MKRIATNLFRNCYASKRCFSNVKDLVEGEAPTIAGKSDKQYDDNWSTLPYPEGANIQNDRRQQGFKPARQSINPEKTSIILFPGQGAQFVGMGQNLLKFPGARDIFELANEVLKYDLLKICLEGPKNVLEKTIHCQPAIMVTSLASLEKLKEERPSTIENCVATAGFSLGEITALVFAGALQFDQALKLVQVRAEAMQLASENSDGGMATVLYGPDSDLSVACEKAKQWCLEKGIENPECKIANYLFPHCKVVAGNLEALRYLETNLKRFKLKRIKKLPVNGAFHTSLMDSAVEPFKRALDKISIENPLINVHSNVDGKCYKNATHIRHQLPKQIIRPVKWEQTMHTIYEREQGVKFPRTFECGPGNGLTTILKQNNAKAFNEAQNIQT